MINAVLTGDREVIAQFDAMPASVRNMLRAKIYSLALRLKSHVQKNKLSGQVLNVVTGALRRSIDQIVREDADSIIGEIFSSGDVKYARIHELGGTIKHPGGTAYFMGGGGKANFISNLYASQVRGAGFPRTKPHDITMPERSFLRSSLEDMAPTIMREMKEAVIQGLIQAQRGGG